MELEQGHPAFTGNCWDWHSISSHNEALFESAILQLELEITYDGFTTAEGNSGTIYRI